MALLGSRESMKTTMADSKPHLPTKARLFKAQCGECGYPVYVTRKWLTEAGTPVCPEGHGAMEWPTKLEAPTAGREPKPMRDDWVTLRSTQVCGQCNTERYAGDLMRRVTYAAEGRIENTYTCLECDDRRRASYDGPAPLRGHTEYSHGGRW